MSSYSMSLNFQQKQGLKQTQRLVMSPQMQQAINLLQVPVLELEMMVNAELEQNPVLEYLSDTKDQDLQKMEKEEADVNQDQDLVAEKEISFDDKDFEIMKRLDEDFREHFSGAESFQPKRSSDEEKLKSFLESMVQSDSSLFDHLMTQAKENFEDLEELRAAELIIGDLDEKGFLSAPLEEIAFLHSIDIEVLKLVLDEIHSFEPVGVGARDLRESLLIQLKYQGKTHSLAYQIIEHQYNELLKNKIPIMQKKLGAHAKEIKEAIENDISKLDLNPGAIYSSVPVQHITSDVVVKEEGDKLVVEVDSETLPNLRVNPRYMRMLDDKGLNEETREYVKQKLISGKWLLKNIHQRNETLYRITECLVKKQEKFFRESDGVLKPLTMKVIAEELELHESTIARAVSNKYVSCSRGVLLLRSFFTNGYLTEEGKDISSLTVKDKLLEVIREEDGRKPLSDEAISKALKEQGVNCARRTVAKYRRELNIGTASQRRSYD